MFKWEYKLVQPLWKKAWQFLLKSKHLITARPALTLPDIYPREIKTYDQQLHL